MKKIKIIALFGPAGAGKDFLLALWEGKFQLHKIINHTTRPMRERECYGNPYYFINDAFFSAMAKNQDFIQISSFNDWHYGTSFNELKVNEVNIGVFNIEAIKQLLQDPRLEVMPVLITTSHKTRLIRQLNRESEPDCLEICRRFLTDNQDYVDIPFDYICYQNNTGIPFDEAYDTLKTILIEWQKSLMKNEE